jgi:serine/threonine protein kinase
MLYAANNGPMTRPQGDACISDFGMAKVVAEMTKTPLSTTMARSGSTRWLAPEVILGEPPSKASDTYSFGMAILEFLTGKRPFREHRSDAAVVQALTAVNERPRRPEGYEVERWLTDDLWALLQRCWAKQPDLRPTMKDVVSVLTEL